ncbi:MAG: FadR/GntR family transcriptional regulator [Galactobacter sp.]
MAFIPIPAHRVNAYEAIVDQIEHAIAQQDLKAGDRLPGERQLMGDFGVSRATVREALRVLKAHGLVESRPGDPRGPVITSYSPQLLQESLSRLALSPNTGRAEILQFRLLLAGHAAQLAAVAHTDKDLKGIGNAVSGLETTDAADADAVASAITEFHAAVNHAAHNQFIEACGNAIADVLRTLVASRLATDGDSAALLSTSVQDSQALLAAIAAGNPSQAYARATQNIYRYYEADLTHDERQGLAVLRDQH